MIGFILTFLMAVVIIYLIHYKNILDQNRFVDSHPPPIQDISKINDMIDAIRKRIETLDLQQPTQHFTTAIVTASIPCHTSCIDTNISDCRHHNEL